MLQTVDTKDFYSFPPAQREEICNWLKANGIDPFDVFLVAVVDEGVCVAGRYDKDENGKRFLNAAGDVSIHDYTFVPTTPPPWVRWT